MELIYSTILVQEDFFNTLIWHSFFILIPFLIAFFIKKFRIFYIFSVIMSLILVSDSYFYFKYKNDIHKFNIYKANSNIIIRVYINKELKYEYKYTDIDFKTLKLEVKTDVSIVGKGTSRIKKGIISYVHKKQKYNLLSTTNEYLGKKLKYSDIQNIYNKLFLGKD